MLYGNVDFSAYFERKKAKIPAIQRPLISIIAMISNMQLLLENKFTQPITNSLKMNTDV